MGKIKAVIILVFIIGLAGAGFWFRNDIFSKIENFTKTEIGLVLSEASKEILTPPPLNFGGLSNNVVLTKDKIIYQTNLQRYQNANLPALAENSVLNEIAMSKAEDMFEKQYFEHVSPEGLGPAQLVESFGYQYITTGENLILGNFKNEQELVQAWMDSPGHRENILNNRYSEIGVAIIKGTYQGKSAWIGVQEFGLPLSACSQPNKALENEIESNNARLELMSLELEQKRGQLNQLNRRSENYSQFVEEYNQLVKDYNALAEATKSDVEQYNIQVNNFNDCLAGD